MITTRNWSLCSIVVLIILAVAFSMATITAAQDIVDGNASDFPLAEQPPESPLGTKVPGSGPVEIGGCLIDTWQTVAPVNTARSRPGLAYLEATGKFYLVGGESSGGNRDNPIEEYDPVADSWSDRSNLLTGVSNSGAVGVGQYVYVPGGYTGIGVEDLQRFDPLANSVTTLASMPLANFAHAVAAQDGLIYVLGGSSTGSEGTTNYIYNIATDSWSTGAALPTPVHYPAATSDGTHIYVLGGNTTDVATVQRYNPVANSWDTIADMAAGRGGPGAFFDGSNIWVVGGGWFNYLPSTEYWDGSNWINGPTLNVGARTVGAAFGGSIALKAAGWNGTYVDTAETLQINCQKYIYLPLITHKPMQTVFWENFSADPNLGNAWTIYRGTDDPSTEAWWDPAAEEFYLTTAAVEKSAAVFADFALPQDEWKVEFDYRIGGGTGNGDGFTFMFFKDESSFAVDPPGIGGTLGFQTAVPVPGYGIEFDSVHNPELNDPLGAHIALIDDSVDQHLDAVLTLVAGSGGWHHAVIQYDHGEIKVTVDGDLLLSYVIAAPETQYTGVGFSAGTGWFTNQHVIDNFKIHKPVP